MRKAKVFLVKQYHNGLFEIYENPKEYVGLRKNRILYEASEEQAESRLDLRQVVRQFEAFFQEPDKDITNELKITAFDGQHGWLEASMYKGQSVNKLIRNGEVHIREMRVYLKS